MVLDEFLVVIFGWIFIFGLKGFILGCLMLEYYIWENFNKMLEEVFDWVGFSGDYFCMIVFV